MDEKTRYYLIACGTSEYEYFDDSQQLKSVSRDLQIVSDLFASKFGYERVLPTLGINPESEKFIKNQFADWLRDQERRETDVVIFYYSGHGEHIKGDRHYLLLHDTDPQKIALDALATEDLVRPLNLEGVKIGQILYIIDTCHSQGGAGDIIDFVSNAIEQYQKVEEKENIEVHVIAACRVKQLAQEGVFSQLLREVLDEKAEKGILKGYINPAEIVDEINKKIISNQQRVVYNPIAQETLAKFFPIIPRTLQTWEKKRYEFVDKLLTILNKSPEDSLLNVNFFLLGSSKFFEELILADLSLKGKLEELSTKSVKEYICPLIACSEWFRRIFCQNSEQILNEEINNWQQEVIQYREEAKLDEIRNFVKNCFDTFETVIQQGDLRVQIIIKPKLDEVRNTGLTSGLYSFNLNLWIGNKKHPIHPFAEDILLNLQEDKEDSRGDMCDRLKTSLEKEDFLSDWILKVLCSLNSPVKLKIEFFVPFDLYQVSVEEICFKSGHKKKPWGGEYPIFINSYERYSDINLKEYQVIHNAIYFKKKELWSENNNLEPDDFCFIGTQPSEDDLVRIEEELPLAVWSRNKNEIDQDIKISEWKDWPQKILELRKHRKDLEITLFWDDTYPKPRKKRLFNTDHVKRAKT